MSFIGTQPGYAYSTITKDTFNGDDSTTEFTLSTPATTNGVEVFVENVQQEPTTAYTVSGTTLTFTAAPVSGTGNIYVVHRNPTVQTLVPPSDIAVNVASVSTTGNASISGSATIGDGLTVDNDGATVATFDRATSNGTIVDLQKDGTAVGSIGTYDTDIHIGSGDVGLSFYDAGDTVLPFNPSTPVYRDNAIDLGNSSNRFKDLYLSGGVVFGDAGGSGTATSNTLDSFEEGTWTPFLSCTGGNTGITYSSQVAAYTKIGNIVISNAIIVLSSKGTASGEVRISGWPFTPVNTSGYSQVGTIGLNSTVSGGVFDGDFDCWGQLLPGDATFRMYSLDGDGGVTQMNTGHIHNTTSFRVSITYHV